MRAGILLLLALACAAGPAASQTDCWKAAQTQADVARCSREDAAKAQARLDRLLGELRAAAPERAAGLERAQAAWRAYADEHCRWEGSRVEGGSMQPAVLAGCMAELTERRVAELKDHLCEPDPGDCPEAAAYDVP